VHDTISNSLEASILVATDQLHIKDSCQEVVGRAFNRCQSFGDTISFSFSISIKYQLRPLTSNNEAILPRTPTTHLSR
ncbi:MAG: hypothetical protein Q9M19_02920, partial [Mariprofundaceae bacterium]|nr:hypothetical protein [Mariprofundaceae bacterium]